MTVLRATLAVVALIYIGMWVIALSGSPSLVRILLVPPALVALVAGGNWLSQYMGLPSRKPPEYYEPPHEES